MSSMGPSRCSTWMSRSAVLPHPTGSGCWLQHGSYLGPARSPKRPLPWPVPNNADPSGGVRDNISVRANGLTSQVSTARADGGFSPWPLVLDRPLTYRARDSAVWPGSFRQRRRRMASTEPSGCTETGPFQRGARVSRGQVDRRA